MDVLDHSGVSVDPDRLFRLRFAAAEARRALSRRTSARPGPFVTKRRGRGSETDDVRTWSHGDDIRHIDRNVTARTGVPHVRTFRDEREKTTLLLADFRPPMLFGTRRAFLSVAAAELLALIGWSVAEDGGRVGVLAVGGAEPEFVRPVVGERAMVAVIGALARAHRSALDSEAKKTQPLAPDIEAAGRLLPPGGTLAIATALDAPGDGFDETVVRAVHRADVTVFVMTDAFERQPPAGVYPFLSVDGRRAVGAIPADVAPAADRRLDRLAALGASAIAVAAEENPETLLRVIEAIHGR
ncbi:DUF58 domain-containing protein [Chthonobacter albigriseus]|uniref:DUF58 domain-containing protein n=1 Tax=Chthonobacter albigriseus TaxID=1683161 RepID=UPI0015EEA7DB|nr:DUF58 domain-containing protein [Chthonobacter albigriseus]